MCGERNGEVTARSRPSRISGAASVPDRGDPPGAVRKAHSNSVWGKDIVPATIENSSTPTPYTLSHCPYCSLQCGISMAPAVVGRPQLTLQPQQDFPTNRGGLCSKGWSCDQAAGSSGSWAHAILLVRAVAGRSPESRLRPAGWDEALDVVADGSAGFGTDGADAVGCFGGGGSPTRRRTCSASSPGSPLGDGETSTTTAATACRSGDGRNRAFGVDRGLPFPRRDIADAGGHPLVGATPRRHAAPDHAVVRDGAGHRRGAWSSTPDGPRRPAAAALHLAAAPGHRPGSGQRAAVHRDRGPARRPVHRRRTTGFDAVRAAVDLRPGGWNGSPACQRRSCGRWSAGWPGPSGAWS